MVTKPNPKDSMKSTWRANREQWTIIHWLYEVFDIYPNFLDLEVPLHSKQDKVPHVPDWQHHRWILFHACVPLIIHQILESYMGCKLSSTAAFNFYNAAFIAIGIHELQMLRRLGHIHGFFDGDKHERNGVPDIGVEKVIYSVLSTTTFRTMISVFLSYDASRAPVSMSWSWLPLEIGLYSIVLDFWFYWCHRLMHTTSLWRYHRTHHLAKHPNPLLTLYAGTEEMVIDIVGIPLLSYFCLKLMGLPMGFYEWWVCHQYVVYSELFGHSGIRIQFLAPSTLTWLLKIWDADLALEDHDIHHRMGWRKSYNYGKQTRLWDRVFGTCGSRIECSKGNIDYANPATIPLFWKSLPHNRGAASTKPNISG